MRFSRRKEGRERERRDGEGEKISRSENGHLNYVITK
jgi:hypothetical protein